MQLGLEEYISFEVKNVKKIKGHFGFIVVLNYNDDSTKTQQHAGFLTDVYKRQISGRYLAVLFFYSF